ncbi:MAG: penicillin-binding protein 2 [Myxococcaceae bacterium]|nr:penicillin-binding protein 2 [Myxococcaceae bacterium]
MTLGQNSPGKDLKVRYLYLGGVFVLGLLVLAVRLYRLQITRGEEFAARSVANFVKEIRIPADRGMILDDTGRILVDGRPSFDVMVTPAFCANCRDEVLPKLAAWLGWDDAQLDEVWKVVQRARRDAPFRPVPVKIDVSRDLADVLDAHLTELPGVEVQATPHRNYRTGTLASHVIGYMNEITTEELDRLNAKGGRYALGDYIGRRGMEKAFESWLRGTDGERKQVVDARGKPIPGLSDLVGSDKVIPPIPGNNVVLSLDMRLQEEAERVFPGRAGGVVMVEVNTGFVKALWSKPGYDPNLLTGRITAAQLAELTGDPLQPMMNRITQMHYSPGSTFKVVTALAALRENVYTASTHVNCPGGYRLGRRVWRCDKESGHGLLDVTHAIQQSCDVYFYKAADLMGINPIAREARELGLGAPTGITGLLEEPGIIPDEAYHDRVTPGGYQKGMALNTSIGQGDVNVTPIQLVMLYAALANGGKLYRPQLVRRIEAPDGRVLKTFEPELVRTVEMKPEHRALVIEGLRMVVNEPGGTAYWRRLKDIQVAGKTGTAQVVRLGDVRHKAEDLDYWVRDHAWFAAFAPVENPEIAVVVLNEHSGFGASNAAPVAMAMIQKYFDLKKEDAARALMAKEGLSGEAPEVTTVATTLEPEAVTAPAPGSPVPTPDEDAPPAEAEKKEVAQIAPETAPGARTLPATLMAPGIGGGPTNGAAGLLPVAAHPASGMGSGIGGEQAPAGSPGADSALRPAGATSSMEGALRPAGGPPAGVPAGPAQWTEEGGAAVWPATSPTQRPAGSTATPASATVPAHPRGVGAAGSPPTNPVQPPPAAATPASSATSPQQSAGGAVAPATPVTSSAQHPAVGAAGGLAASSTPHPAGSSPTPTSATRSPRHPGIGAADVPTTPASTTPVQHSGVGGQRPVEATTAPPRRAAGPDAARGPLAPEAGSAQPQANATAGARAASEAPHPESGSRDGGPAVPAKRRPPNDAANAGPVPATAESEPEGAP